MAEIGDLPRRDGARLAIDDAERAEIEPVIRPQRHAGIKAQSEIAGDERIGERADIRLGVGDYPGIGSQYRRGAQTR